MTMRFLRVLGWVILTVCAVGLVLVLVIYFVVTTA